MNGASGGVGLATVNSSARWGAALAGVTSMSKADAVLAAGAHHVIDLSVDDLRNGLRDQVHAVTDGKGCDICVDMLGEILGASRALAWCGRLVVGLCGEAHSRGPRELPPGQEHRGDGLQWSDYRDRTGLVAEAQERMTAMVVEGTLEVPVMEFRSRASPMRWAYSRIGGSSARSMVP